VLHGEQMMTKKTDAKSLSELFVIYLLDIDAGRDNNLQYLKTNYKLEQ